MSSDQVLVGLDIGTTTVRVVVGKREPDGAPPSIISVGEAPSPALLGCPPFHSRYTPDRC